MFIKRKSMSFHIFLKMDEIYLNKKKKKRIMFLQSVICIYIFHHFRYAEKNDTSSPVNRYRNLYAWKSNIRKRLRQTGQSYVGINGATMPERQIRTGCPSTCTFRCHSKFNSDDRFELHKQFWSLSDAQKYDYYNKFASRHYAARKRTKSENSRRLFSFVYFFDIGDGKRTQVCQKFFLNTLDICKGRVYYYFNNIKKEEAIVNEPSNSNQEIVSQIKTKKRQRIGRIDKIKWIP